MAGKEDKLSGQMKQGRGKANEIAGAVRGDTSQELKGKIEKNVGKAQEKLGEKRDAKRDEDRGRRH